MEKSQTPRKIDHVGIAVKSLTDALPFYVDHLNMELEDIEEVESEMVKVAFLRVGESRIELLEPTSQNSPVAKFIEKRGEGIHHIALGVNRIAERINDLKAGGIRMLNNEAKAGAGGARIAFIHPQASSGVLYELCEKEEQKEDE